MSKSEWIWVSIRIFGVYLLVLAIVAIPEALGSIYGFALLSSAASESPGMASMAGSLHKAALATGLKSTLQVVVFLLAANYFLKHGKAVHSVACRES